MHPQDLTFLLNRSKIEDENETEYKKKLLQTIKIAYDKVKNVKEKEQEKYKVNNDKTHKEIILKEGDLVWVYFGLPEKGKTHKLLSRFDGPY